MTGKREYTVGELVLKYFNLSFDDSSRRYHAVTNTVCRWFKWVNFNISVTRIVFGALAFSSWIHNKFSALLGIQNGRW